MNKILVILDGVGDLPCRELGNKTPLEAANTPNLDLLAKNGKCGLMYTIRKDIAPESDEAMFAILGYNPFKYYTGRGILEAYGGGIRFKKGNLILRCNFVRVKNNKIIDIEAKVKKQILNRLVKELNKIKLTVKHKFIATIGHRCVLILDKGSDKITNTHPGYNIIKNYVTSAVPVNNIMKIKNCIALSKESKITAKNINKFVKESKNIVKNYAVITRGAGNRLPKLKKLKNWILLADMPVEKAIGKLAGMKIIKKSNNYKKDAKVILKLAKKHNVYVQIKGPGSFGHKNKPLLKKKVIERIDKEFFSMIKKFKGMIIVSADHSTPCKFKAHSKDPVPVLIYGKGKDRINKFSEASCKGGSLGKFNGLELMKIINKV